MADLVIETTAVANPFPGLRSFEPDEDHLFFGRESRIDELLTRLRRSRFLSVVGTSGSGKSSLIRSGLIPSLYSGMMAKAGSSWRVVLFRPGEDPIGHLASALAQPDALGTADEGLEGASRALLEVTLRRSAMGLVECVRQARVPAHENVLVVVDQFEELFRFKRSSQQRDSRDEAVAFVKLLLRAVRQDELPIYVVITMRSDFIGNCTEFEGLTEAINDGQYLVPRMTREERRSAISGPVAVSGAEITPRLLLRLLNEVGDDPDQLPILQHALMRTWDEWNRHHAADEPVDLRHYEAIGTMKEALSQHAEEAYRELADEQGRAIAEKVFKALTDRGSDARGVRSPRTLRELCALTDAPEARVVEVIEAFRRPGRSFLMPPSSVPLRPDTVVDISHESLMRIWKRLIVWVDEEARSAQVYLRISEAAAQYQDGKAGLLHDPELQLALNWREQTRPNAVWAQRYDSAFERALVFLEHSRKQRELSTEERERQRRRQLQRARRLAVVLGAGALVTLLFGLYAVVARLEAEQNYAEAVSQRRIADQQRSEAEKQRELAEAQRLRTEQARSAADEQRRLAETERQRAERQEAEALRQKTQAESARQQEADARGDAERQRQAAVQQRERAEALRVQSEQSEAEARRLRVLAVAREVAVKTSQLARDDQRELAALLAAQAFRLQQRSRGDLADPDLFEALRSTHVRLAPADAQALRYHADAVRCLAVAPGGSQLVSGSDDGTLRLLDLAARDARPALVGQTGSEVRALAWIDGQRLAAGTLDGAIRVFPVPQRGEPLGLAGHPGGVSALALGGSQLASAGLDGSLLLRRPLEASAATTLRPGGTDRLGALAFVQSRLAAATGRGVLLWDPAEPQRAPRALAPPRRIRSLATSGSRLAAGTEDGPVLLWTAGLERAPVELAAHTAAVTSLGFSPDGSRLASASLDGSVRLWDAARPERKPIRLAGHAGWVWAVAFAGDGETLVSGGADRTVRIWPTRPQPLAAAICAQVKRSLTKQEWSAYLPADIEWEATCP